MYKFKMPCVNCICVPMCFNKNVFEICYCELLEPIFYERCNNLSPYNKVYNKLELRITPFDVTLLLIRDTLEYGSVHIINLATSGHSYVRLVNLKEGVVL